MYCPPNSSIVSASSTHQEPIALRRVARLFDKAVEGAHVNDVEKVPVISLTHGAEVRAEQSGKQKVRQRATY